MAVAATLGATAGAICGFGTSCLHGKLKDPLKAIQEAKRACLPDRVILVRHGESEANADHTLWRDKADNLISLSDKGQAQAVNAGDRIRKIIGDESVAFYTSPFQRTIQTLRGIRKAFKDKPGWRDNEEDARSRHCGATEGWVTMDPNIREQEMGSNMKNLQGDEAAECRRIQRDVIGRFYYRFPAGESGADVFERTKLWWCNDLLNVNSEYNSTPVQNIVVVTHGLTMRFILMVVMDWSVNTFETVWNADNCAVWVLKKDLSRNGLSPYVLEAGAGDAVNSSRCIGVTFKDESAAKTLELQDYLSIPPPRTRQFAHVKNMLATQHGLDPQSIDRLDFYSETSGSLANFAIAGKKPESSHSMSRLSS